MKDVILSSYERDRLLEAFCGDNPKADFKREINKILLKRIKNLFALMEINNKDLFNAESDKDKFTFKYLGDFPTITFYNS